MLINELFQVEFSFITSTNTKLLMTSSSIILSLNKHHENIRSIDKKMIKMLLLNFNAYRFLLVNIQIPALI